ncbi:hypothetical protein YC2023_085750 [Brassica napus]
MAKKRNPKKPSTNQIPTGSGQKSSQETKFTPEIPAVNSESVPQQGLPVNTEASTGQNSLVEPPYSAPAADGKVYRRKDQGSSLETTTPPTSNSFQLLDSVPETLSEPPQKSFAEVSAQQVNNSITLGSGNQVAALALQPVTSAKKISTVTAQDSTLVFNYDLSKGGLCVDLSSHLSSPANVSSEDDSANGYVSSSENFSGEDDNSYDGNDKFIEVVSKRLRRHSKYQLGGRGPLTL